MNADKNSPASDAWADEISAGGEANQREKQALNSYNII